MLLLVLDLLGVAVFALSGALVAVRQRLDVVGVLTLATVTGLGGGWIRDVMIGVIPPTGLADWRYLLVPTPMALTVYFWHPRLMRRDRTIDSFDAFGLGLFCVAGALKASEHGLGPAPAAFLGVVTAVGGGVIRDVLSGLVPMVLRRSQLYAVPAMIGATITAIGFQAGWPTPWFAVPAALAAAVIRLLAVWRGWVSLGPVGLGDDCGQEER